MATSIYCAFGRRVGLLLGSAALATACAQASDHDRFPAVSEEITIAQTVPAAGTSGVSTRVRIDLCWSDIVDPRSVSDVDATISSGNTVVDTDLQVQLVPWRGAGGAPLPDDVTEPWCSGSVLSVTPEAPLAGGVTHRLRLEPNVVGWDGQPADTTVTGWLEDDAGDVAFQLEFAVGLEEEPEPPPAEPAPTLRSLFEPGAVFDRTRGLCSCHVGSDPAAHGRLDLSDPFVAYQALVVPARPRDTGFPMVTPRRPSESFLLHKLVRTADDSPLRGLLGAPMPDDGDPIPYRDLVSIARWIEGGAAL